MEKFSKELSRLTVTISSLLSPSELIPSRLWLHDSTKSSFYQYHQWPPALFNPVIDSAPSASALSSIFKVASLGHQWQLTFLSLWNPLFTWNPPSFGPPPPQRLLSVSLYKSSLPSRALSVRGPQQSSGLVCVLFSLLHILKCHLYVYDPWIVISSLNLSSGLLTFIHPTTGLMGISNIVCWTLNSPSFPRPYPLQSSFLSQWLSPSSKWSLWRSRVILDFSSLYIGSISKFQRFYL